MWAVYEKVMLGEYKRYKLLYIKHFETVKEARDYARGLASPGHKYVVKKMARGGRSTWNPGFLLKKLKKGITGQIKITGKGRNRRLEIHT